MSEAASARRVKELARERGFRLCRISSADILEEARDRYLDWVRAKRQGEMAWIDEHRAIKSSDPAAVLEGARSVICVGMPYWAGLRPPSDARTGLIARYAWGRDYHAVLGERLRDLSEALRRELGGDCRGYVDTGPVMDKALAERAGLGWYGRNSNLLTEEYGSFVLLGEIVTTLSLRPDPPLRRDCGSCRLCVVACPTGAIGPDYSVDSRKCISYLTIEHRGPIPPELRPLMGAWVFGCDVCQDVCPPTMERFLRGDERNEWAAGLRAVVQGERWLPGPVGHRVGESSSPLFDSGRRPSADLFWLARLSHEEYVEAFRGTSIKRAKVWMLRRNAVIALGNVADLTAVEVLVDVLVNDDSELVRGHAAWALGRLGARHQPGAVLPRLAEAARAEKSPYVLEEIHAAQATARSA